MRLFSSFIFFIFLIFHSSASENFQDYSLLCGVVKNGGEELLRKVREEKISAPLIHSKWFVDERIAKQSPDIAEIEYAKREFGRVWLIQLEKESLRIQALATNAEHEANARILLDLADWIGSEGGYGNLWLFYRLQDLANISIGHLLSDNDYPMPLLEQTAARLLNSNEIFIKIGIPALNSEAPEPVFKAGSVEPDSKYGSPRTKWEKEDDILRPSFLLWQKKQAEIKDCLNKIQRTNNTEDLSGSDKRNCVPDNLQFFIDDSDDYTFDSRPFTALEHWDDKFHYKFLLGLVGSKVKKSLALLEFRRKVGGIPAPAVYSPERKARAEKEREKARQRGEVFLALWEVPGYDAQEDAFDQAWKAIPGISKDNRNLNTDAYTIFKLAHENKLVDDDYEETVRRKREIAWKEHVAKQRSDYEEYTKLDKETPIYVKFSETRDMWKKAIKDTNQIESEILRLMNEAGINWESPPLDSEFLFLLRDEKYDEAEIYFEKKKQNATGRLPNREDIIYQIEELLTKESNSLKRQVVMERIYQKAKKEYEEYQKDLDQKRKEQSQKEVENYLRNTN